MPTVEEKYEALLKTIGSEASTAGDAWNLIAGALGIASSHADGRTVAIFEAIAADLDKAAEEFGVHPQTEAKAKPLASAQPQA
jgi:hypothetical protein